jgi:hypothetical protein
MYRKSNKEKHVSLVQEPGGQYMGRLTLKSGNGSEIAKSIMCYLTQKCRLRKIDVYWL